MSEDGGEFCSLCAELFDNGGVALAAVQPVIDLVDLRLEGGLVSGKENRVGAVEGGAMLGFQVGAGWPAGRLLWGEHTVVERSDVIAVGEGCDDGVGSAVVDGDLCSEVQHFVLFLACDGDGFGDEDGGLLPGDGAAVAAGAGK